MNKNLILSVFVLCFLFPLAIKAMTRLEIEQAYDDSRIGSLCSIPRERFVDEVYSSPGLINKTIISAPNVVCRYSYNGAVLTINDKQYPPAKVIQMNNLNITNATTGSINQKNSFNSSKEENVVTWLLKNSFISIILLIIGFFINRYLNKKFPN